MWIKSLIIFWWILSLVYLFRRKLLKFIRSIKFLELLSTLLKTKISIRKIEVKKQAIKTLKPDWHKSQLLIWIKVKQNNKILQRDSKVRCIVINAPETTKICRLKWSWFNRRSRKSRRNFWTQWWRGQNSCLLSSRENWWQTKAYKRCWSTSTEFWIVKLSTKSILHIATTPKFSL